MTKSEEPEFFELNPDLDILEVSEFSLLVNGVAFRQIENKDVRLTVIEPNALFGLITLVGLTGLKKFLYIKKS